MFKSKYILYLFILVITLLSSCRRQRDITRPGFTIEHEDIYISEYTDYSSLSEKLGFEPQGNENLKLLQEIVFWLDTPYKYGGNTKQGIDCSGLVLNVYRNIYDINLARHSIDMAKNARKVSNKNNLREGDLVFFRIDKRNISHVGIYLGNNRFIHASSTRGVVINNLDETYYAERYAFGGRIIR